MRYANIELHNVQELLPRRLAEILPAATLAQLQQLAQARGEIVPDAGMAGGLWISRLPDALRLRLNPLAQINALATAGCEVRCRLRGGPAGVTLQGMQSPAIVEVYQGVFPVAWHVVGTEPLTIPLAQPVDMANLLRVSAERSLPFDAHLTRLILPRRPSVRLLAVEGDLDPPQPGDTPATTCLFYGSSITHGQTALGPAGSYAYRTSQLLGFEMINLGLGGAAHLEPEMAGYIAGRPGWDLAVLELGINLIGSIDVEEFERRVRTFVSTIARRHPDRWIFCVDLFTCRYDIENPGRIAAFRRVVRETVKDLALPMLVHLAGDALLPGYAGLTADLVHPASTGMEEIARRLSQAIAGRLGTAVSGG